jgi:hypothetical protein
MIEYLTMPGVLQTTIVYNQTNVFGLTKDAELLSEAIPIAARSVGERAGPVKLLDSRQPPSPCDICIHLEIPYAVWFPWARVNVVLVNGEWWLEKSWSDYWPKIDIAIFRDQASLERCVAAGAAPLRSIVLPWCVGPLKAPAAKAPKKPVPSVNVRDGFVWFIGGSPNKRAAAEAVLPLWKDTWPRLLITSVEPLNVHAASLPQNITLQTGILGISEIEAMSAAHPGHICLSKAESFGYTAAEAEVEAAFTLLNTLPCYKEIFGDSPGAHFIETPLDANGAADFSNTQNLAEALDAGVEAFKVADLSVNLRARKERAERRRIDFQTGMGTFIKAVVEAWEIREPLPKHMPPILQPEGCPPISVITLVHNRPKFIENCFVNLLSTDYPREKIEWVVVDDSDPTESASDKIIQFQQKFAPGIVSYVPMTKARSIGYKRNLGVQTAKHDVLLMMDDDDHYPSTSFRRRVAWLLKGRRRYQAAVCTTIAMYDLLKGVSAVNVPPYNLSLAERCSEATLTFTRGFWLERKFEDTSMAEGEGFLKGRLADVVEIPPQQIIVAFTHGTNTGGRKMPDAGNGCFWGFPRPFLEFIHGLVGVKVEEA